MILTSDKPNRHDTIEVSVNKNRVWLAYNPETKQHDKREPENDNVVLCINEWEQVTLEKEKVILLIAELKKLIK